MPADFADHPPDYAGTVDSTEVVIARLSAERTAQLLRRVPAVYRTQINDALLTALTRAFVPLAAPGSRPETPPRPSSAFARAAAALGVLARTPRRFSDPRPAPRPRTWADLPRPALAPGPGGLRARLHRSSRRFRRPLGRDLPRRARGSPGSSSRRRALAAGPASGAGGRFRRSARYPSPSVNRPSPSSGFGARAGLDSPWDE